MFTDIKAFYDQFVEDFSLFDAKVIASKYQAPYTAVSAEGDIWESKEADEILTYFQILLDKHASEGVVACKYENLECVAIGKSCFLATVTWTMMKAGGEVTSNWRESYNLVRTNDGLKIFTSIDH